MSRPSARAPRRVPRPLVLAAAATLAAWPATAEEVPAAPAEAPSPAEVLIAQAAEENLVHDHLVELTETFGHRLTGSSSLTAAGEWAVERFASWGLDARLEPWGEVPVGFELGAQSGSISIDGGEAAALTFVTQAWTAGTDGPLTGPAVLEPVALEGFEPERYAGAWVVRRLRDRPAAELRDELDDLLERAGMVGEVRNGGRNPAVGGRWPESMDAVPERPSTRLVQADYDKLTDALEAGSEVTLTFDLEHTFVEGPIEQYNVVADLVGSEFPDEYVIVCGHLDSWTAAVGAQDNGTGVSTTLEAARLITAAGLQPRRTIRFVLWGGEEQGLLGAQAYVREHPDVLDRTSAVLNHDNGGNYLSGISGPAALVDDLRAVFAPVAELSEEMPFTVSENRGLSRAGMSDHAAFVQRGVPGFFWAQSGELEYRYIHHTRHDHVDQVNLAYQEHSAVIVAVGALGIANLDGLLDRTDLVRPARMSNRRTMGVYLDDARVTDVIDGGKAAALGWKAGDVIVAVEGVAVGTREEIVSELQKGEPVKTITILRGEERLEYVFDWRRKR